MLQSKIPLVFCAAFAWLMFDSTAAGAEPSAPVRITFPNLNIFQSPYTWRNANGSAIAPTGGAYMRGVVKGTTSIRANVDTSINAPNAPDDMPTLKVTIDDQPQVFVQFAPGAKQVTLAAVTPDEHRFRIEVIGGNQGKGDGWASTSFHTKIDSLELDAGATTSPPTLRPKRALILGDSNIQAYFGGPQGRPYYEFVDYTLSWPGYVALAFDCEFGQIGVGGAGWIHEGQGGYGAMPAWWDHYDRDHARDLSLSPDFVWVALGANDHNADPAALQRIIQKWLAVAREQFPKAEIFAVVPFHGENRAAVTAAAQASHVHLIDLGPEVQSAIPFIPGRATWLTMDGLHPRAIYHGLLAAGIARQSLAQAQLPPERK